MEKNIMKTIFISLFVALTAIQLTGCQEAKIILFEDKPALYFPRGSEPDGIYGTRIDTAHVSFFHNPGKETLDVPYKIRLIGRLLTEDTEYSVEVVDSLTTAKPDEYRLPEKILFKKGTATDFLNITIIKKERLSTESAMLVLSVKENDNFKLGYNNMLRISLRFDNIVSKPVWWDKTIEFVYLGKFSAKKYHIYVEHSGKVDIEGLEPWELRNICLDMKNYIKENGITEEDGTPMEIVCN